MAAVSQKSALKTAIKKVLAAVDAKDKEAALVAYNDASSKLYSMIVCIFHDFCTFHQEVHPGRGYGSDHFLYLPIIFAYNDASSKLDKAVAKGIHHKNYVFIKMIIWII